MAVVLDDPGAKLAKDIAFGILPFKEVFIVILEANSRNNFCLTSVYDLLEEKFIENGDFKALSGNEQMLRNYVHYLKDVGAVTLKSNIGGSMIMSLILHPWSRCLSTLVN